MTLKMLPAQCPKAPSARMQKEMKPPRLALRRKQEQPHKQGHNSKLGRRAKTSRKTPAARAKLLRSELLTQKKTLLARPTFLRKWLVVGGLLVKGAYPRVMPARLLPKKELLVQTAALARRFARKLARPLERTPLAAKRIVKLLAKLLTNRLLPIKTPLSARRPPIEKTLSLTGGYAWRRRWGRGRRYHCGESHKEQRTYVPWWRTTLCDEHLSS